MAGVKDFVVGQTQGLAERAQELGKKPTAAARRAALKSAAGLKSLKDPVRAVARSGVRMTSISQGTAQGLIELQERIVTSALDDAATQLERAAASDSVQDLVRDQARVLLDARERIVADMAQALKLLKDAGGDAREVATRTYGTVTKLPASKAKKKTKAKTKAKAKRKASAPKKAAARRKSTARKAKRTRRSSASGVRRR